MKNEKQEIRNWNKKVYCFGNLECSRIFYAMRTGLFYILKPYAMQTTYTISEDLHDELEGFFNNHDIALLNQNLRRLLVDFLDYELRTGVPLYFDGFFFPFNKLLDVLDIAAQEIHTHEMAEKTKAMTVTINPTPIEKVIAFIKTSLNPACIFLLHHFISNDNREHFDLLVVIPATSNTGFAYYEQLITMANMEDIIINVSLHKEEVIQQQLKDGHIYYSIACNKKNMVYKNNGFELPEPNTAALNLLAEKAATEFNRAHKKADCFLNGAANYRSENEKEMAVFMLHQSVELTLRGLTTALLGNCTKTHCLRELQKPLKRCAPEIEYLFSADAAEENRLITLLEKAYLESRYSSQLVISDKDIDALAEGAEELHEKVKAVFEEKMEQLVNHEVFEKRNI